MRLLALPIVVLCLARAVMPAASATLSRLDDANIPGRNRYERCLTLTKRSAEEAEEFAQIWHDSGGGAAALHCDALALVALRRYAEAAGKLDEAAAIADAHNRALRMALYDQAGNAWLLADRPDKAENSISAALAMSPRDEDILFDRARARAGRKDWAGADADLTALLTIDPERADAFVLRASARHAEGRVADAEADIGRALAVYPNYPEALVERGTIHYEAGDVAAARADWNLVLRVSPDSDASQAARARLSAMDAPKATGR